MNCPDSRDLFSALLDGELGAGERAELDAHLAACADCRGELDRLHRTIAALHGLAPERAPVGFVDRVLRATHSTPWPRRLATRLFRPLRVMLPLQAAAVLLVAGLALYIYQRSPELQQAALPEAPRPAVAPGRSLESAPPAARDAPASLSVPAARQQPAAKPDAGPAQAAQEAKNAERDEPPADTRRDAAPGVAPAAAPLARPAESAVGRAADALTAPARREEATAESAAPAPPPEPRAMAKQRQERAAAKESTLAAAPPVIAGRLQVDDLAAAERSLADLLRSVEATEVARRREGGETVVELVVPGERWPALRDGLGRLGRLHLEGEPATMPVRLTLHLRLSG